MGTIPQRQRSHQTSGGIYFGVDDELVAEVSQHKVERVTDRERQLETFLRGCVPGLRAQIDTGIVGMAFDMEVSYGW